MKPSPHVCWPPEVGAWYNVCASQNWDPCWAQFTTSNTALMNTSHLLLSSAHSVLIQVSLCQQSTAWWAEARPNQHQFGTTSACQAVACCIRMTWSKQYMYCQQQQLCNNCLCSSRTCSNWMVGRLCSKTTDHSVAAQTAAGSAAA